MAALNLRKTAGILNESIFHKIRIVSYPEKTEFPPRALHVVHRQRERLAELLALQQTPQRMSGFSDENGLRRQQRMSSPLFFSFSAVCLSKGQIRSFTDFAICAAR